MHSDWSAVLYQQGETEILEPPPPWTIKHCSRRRSPHMIVVASFCKRKSTRDVPENTSSSVEQWAAETFHEFKTETSHGKHEQR